ncbi:uncharacterized protein LOC114363830 [Ostrinia furnacalis]|uniref:uncharacterized protein LOC114363830 n=1 Tax=Ostrinia furnacalis TaxID=93504 RepID=UPI00103FD8D7|nr:uncharacterized protein LOC114363830 [Ostrinia furnacalis]
MDSLKASGDNNKTSPRCVPEKDIAHEKENVLMPEADDSEVKANEEKPKDITPQMIEENELKLKDRIAQCRNIIESLKMELSKEKSKLEKQAKMPQLPSVSGSVPVYHDLKCDVDIMGDINSTSMYSACVDSKLNCDESLIEYEKQLQKYQNTLNMAQIEKKNAIRKQMLAKAYKLKLLEVENQCNIELLRVKQSLQCLEPLQMIANNWKNSPNDSAYDLNNYELIPRYPELNAHSGSDINSYRDDCDKPSPDKSGICCKEDSSSSEC